VQKLMTGVSGTKPAWPAQKGRGGGEGGVGEGEKREREKKGRSL